MNVFRLEWRTQRRSLLVWAGVVGLIILLLMAFFPAMQNDAMKALAGAKLEGIPDSVLVLMGLDRSTLTLDLSDPFFFFGYVLQFINLALCVFAAQLGSSALIREESDGSIEYLYAQPVTRTRLAAEKMLAGFTIYFLLIFALFAVSIAAFALFTETAAGEAFGKLLLLFSGSLFSGTVFLQAGFLASTLLKNAKRTATFAIAAVFGTFVIGIFSVVSDKLDFLLYFSPVDTAKPTVLLNGGYDPAALTAGLLIAAVCTLLCFRLYQKKDLKS